MQSWFMGLFTAEELNKIVAKDGKLNSTLNSTSTNGTSEEQAKPCTPEPRFARFQNICSNNFFLIGQIYQGKKFKIDVAVNILTLVRSSVTSRFWLRASWFSANLPRWTSWNFGLVFLRVTKPFIIALFRASWILSGQVKNQTTRLDGQVEFKS